MCRWAETFVFAGLLALLLGTLSPRIGAEEKFTGVGRAATRAEIAAWDIDVRPDFKGLPAGAGSVAQGQIIWEDKCASCHGTFGESNEVFTPLVGGTSAADLKSGRVASLIDSKQPQRTTLMKVATVSSLFDYIYRAMPWNAPRSLSVNDTYAVLAFVLNQGEIVADDFTLSEKNIATIQERMPNRNGMTTAHGLRTALDQPDVQGSRCMADCDAFVQIGSSLPDYARNAHNNLAEQNRPWGPFRGANTTRPPLAVLPGRFADSQSAPDTPRTPAPRDLLAAHNCTACHTLGSKLVGPAWRDIAQKYRGKEGVIDALRRKIKLGGAGAWGSIPMPPQTTPSDGEIDGLLHWILETPF